MKGYFLTKTVLVKSLLFLEGGFSTCPSALRVQGCVFGV